MSFMVIFLFLCDAEQIYYTSSLQVTSISTEEVTEGEDLLVTLEREESVPILLLACPNELIFEEEDSDWNVLTTLYSLEPWVDPDSPTATLRIPSQLASLGQTWNLGVYSPVLYSFSYSLRKEIYPADLCLSSCNLNGLCMNGECQCFVGYKGTSCEIKLGSLEYSQNYTLAYSSYEWQFYQFFLPNSKEYICFTADRNTGEVEFFLNFDSNGLPSMLESSAYFYFQDASFEYSFEANEEDSWLLGVYCKSSEPCQFTLVVEHIEEADTNSLWLLILLCIAAFIICMLIPLIIKILLKLRATRQVQDIPLQLMPCKMQKMFPRTRWKKVKDARDSVCTICLDDFTGESYVRILYCGHVYHLNCIDVWVTGRAVCPLCNESVTKRKIREIVSHQEVPGNINEDIRQTHPY